MDPILLASIITAVGPLVVAGIKKLLRTAQIESPENQKMVHKALPLVVGLLAGILNCYGGDSSAELEQCVLAGLAGGAGAAYIRDMDRNILGILAAVAKIIQTKKADR